MKDIQAMSYHELVDYRHEMQARVLYQAWLLIREHARPQFEAMQINKAA